MDSVFIKKYLILFRDKTFRLPEKPIHWFQCYLHSLIAVHVFEESPGKYPTYFDAWSSSSASPMKQYLVEMDSIDPILLNALSDLYTSSRSVTDFIECIVPTLFDGDINTVSSFLNFDHDTFRSTIYSLFRLLCCLYLRTYLYTLPYPSQPKRLTNDEYPAELFDCFINWKHYKVFSKLSNLDANYLFQLWIRIFGFKYSPIRFSIRANISKPIGELKKDGWPEDDILRIYYLSSIYTLLNSKKIEMPVPYLKSIFLKDRTDTSDTLSPGEQFFLEHEALEYALKSWRKTNCVDFVRAYYFNKASHNISTENTIIYNYFFYNRLCRSSFHAFVVEPNPDFIVKALNDSRINNDRIVFVFFSLTLTQIFSLYFPNGNFAYFDPDTSDKDNPKLLIEKVDERYSPLGKEFIASPAPLEECRLALYFIREWRIESISNSLNYFSKKQPFTLFLYTPQSILYKASPDYQDIQKKFKMNWIVLQHNESSSDGLRKKAFLSLSAKKAPSASEDIPVPEWQSEDIPVIRSFSYDCSDSACYVCQDPWPVRIPSDKLLSGEKTLKYLWDYYRPKPTKGKPRTTRFYDFSSEIRIWYSWSNGRGRFAFYDHADPSLKKRLSRGHALIRTPNQIYVSSLEEMVQVIEKTILDDDNWYDVIRNEIKKTYRSIPVSLKTFWYLQLVELKKKAAYKHDVAKILFSSDSLSSILSDNNALTLNDFKERISKSFPDSSDTMDLWQQLNLILSLGVKEGKFSNPISEYFAKLLEKDKGFRAARSALAKKSYTLEEERIMMDYMAGKATEDSKYLGCYISFFSGMTSGEICALTWKDFRKLSGSDKTGQLWVYQKMNNDGTSSWFSSDEKYRFRRIPCVGFLTELLEKRRKTILSKIVSEETTTVEAKIDNYPIICESEKDYSVPCRITTLNEVKDDIERAAKIEVIRGSVIYDDDSEKITDFNDYRADRFRANFRFRAMNTCIMYRAELNYILGISPPNTFSKHYCDYTNDFAQIMLCRKLERWHAAQKATMVPATSTHSLPTSGQIFQRPNEVRRNIEIDLASDLDSSVPALLSVEISDTRGVDISFYRME